MQPPAPVRAHPLPYSNSFHPMPTPQNAHPMLYYYRARPEFKRQVMVKRFATLEVISRLLAVPVESLPIPDGRRDSVTGSEDALVGVEPLSPAMSRRIEELVKLRHRAGVRDVGSQRVFVIPSWLAADRESRARTRTDPLQVHVDVSGGRRVAVGGAPDSRQLESVVLSPRTPQAWRRRWIVRTAASIRHGLTVVLRSSSSDPEWLSEMASAPDDAERAAIAVWNQFLEEVAVPAGLRIPEFEASLAELLQLRDGRHGNGNREWFANRWPAAASALLRGGAAETLRRLDGSRAAAVEIATKAFCCQQKQDCERARRVARAVPSYRDDQCLARVLAGCGPRVDVHIRAILMHANYNDGTLLGRMGQRSQYAREHMELAAAVATHPLFRTAECRMKVGETIARMFAGSGYDPSEFAPEVVARALVAVSADCLAAHASEPTSEAEADALERGVLAFAALISGPGWRLSPPLLAAFVARSRPLAAQVYRSEAADGGSGDALWPMPMTWRSNEHARLHGTYLAPLLSVDEVRAEGGAMAACLESEMFRHSLSLGRLTMFAVRAGQDRATLVLRAVVEDGQLVKYRISGLRGPRNEEPGRACQKAARHLVNRLNTGLPAAAPVALGQRRMRIEDTWVNCNLDKRRADDRWPRYAGCLPERFATTSPAAVVGQWLRAV